MSQSGSFKKGLYDLAGLQLQSVVDRLRYRLKLLPRVNLPESGQDWLPKPYKAALVISADFELGWAWRYVRSEKPSSVAQQSAYRTRQNLPVLIDLFDRYDIPITWATVGHLFLDHCERENGKAHSHLPRPLYFENEYWSYQNGDWYDADPCSSLSEAPEWYAPDLIRAILAAKTRHEIGCHTFSHIDCSDGVCSLELMIAELTECRRLAHAWGIDLKSFVFPANLGGNYNSLKKAGFTNYRFHNHYHLGFPEQDEYGLWRIPGGVCFEIPQGWPVKAWVGALTRCLDRALETGTLLHLWFHPSCDPVNVAQVFPAIVEAISRLRDNLWIVTMAEVCQLAAGKKTIKDALAQTRN